MYIRKIGYYYKGTKKCYAQLVHSYRDESGKVKKKILMNLYPIKNEQDWLKAKQFLQEVKKTKQIPVKLGDLEIIENLEYGLVYILEKIWQTIGLDIFLENLKHKKIKFNPSEIIFLLVANRLSNPSSEYKAIEWIKRDVYYPQKEKIQLHHLYRTLDIMIENKQKIESFLFEKLFKGKKIEFVFYDITSSYFEGNCCSLAEFGYSRDKKRGKKQLLLGIVLCDELPITYFIFKGNIADKKTLQQTLQYLKENFKISKVTFVVDRGMISEENVQAIKESGYEFIIATKRRQGEKIKKLMSYELKAKIERDFYAEEVLKEGELRYILCLNKTRRQQEIQELEEFIKEIQERYRQEYGKKISENRAIILKERFGVKGRIFNLDKNLLSVNEEEFKYEKTIAGKFLLITNTNLGIEKVVDAYKQLNLVEMCFREIKSFLKIRPFYHYTEKRISGHIFICILGLLMEGIIKKQIRIPVRQAIEELRRLKITRIQAKSNKFLIIQKMNTQQRMILKQLNIIEPFWTLMP